MNAVRICLEVVRVTVVLAVAAATAAAAAQPIVDARIVNTPNVTVTNTSPVPVTLGTGAISVQPMQVPYSTDATPSSSGGSCTSNHCFINFPAVPAGKMLAVTYVSSIARSDTAIWDQLELLASNTQDPGVGVRAILGFTKIGLAGSSVISDTYGASGTVLAFIRAGSIPRVTVSTRNGGANTGFVFTQATISGYLIPAP